MKIYKGENQCKKLQGKLNKVTERKEKVKLEKKKETKIIMIAEINIMKAWEERKRGKIVSVSIRDKNNAMNKRPEK